MENHILTAYQVLQNLLAKERIGSLIDTTADCLVVELAADTAVRVHHYEMNVNGSDQGWVIEYGHAEDADQRGCITGTRPGATFADLTEMIRIAIRLTELQAFPLSR